jgi:hypothetical protein
VLASPLSLPPAPADLKDLLISRGKHALHAKLGRSVKKPFSRRNRIDIRFRGWSGYPMRGLYFEVPPIRKEEPDGLDDAGPLIEGIPAGSQLPVYAHDLSPAFFRLIKNVRMQARSEAGRGQVERGLNEPPAQPTSRPQTCFSVTLVEYSPVRVSMDQLTSTTKGNAKDITTLDRGRL